MSLLQTLLNEEDIVGSKVIVDSNGFKVTLFNSFSSISKFSKGSKWDIKDKKYFDMYKKSGDFYGITYDNGTKKALGWVQDKIMKILQDQDDKRLQPSELQKYPEWEDFLSKLQIKVDLNKSPNF